jgi:GMP synthase (glutamine-hydrolysing)
MADVSNGCSEWLLQLCGRAARGRDHRFHDRGWADLPYDFLDHVSRRIMNEIADIARVVYDISGKPPGTIEWE